MTIGVFDSGIGGLSVANAIQAAFPEHHIDFANDSANMPYGDKTPQQMAGLALRVLRPMAARCDVIVIACNSLTTNAIGLLRRELPVPLVGIEPMVKPAAELTKSQIIAVCATAATLSSARYAALKRQYALGVTVLEPDCTGWATMIQTNAVDRDQVTRLIDDVCAKGADVVVLGCTHYHWIEELVRQAARGRAEILQPEQAVIKRLWHVLQELPRSA